MSSLGDASFWLAQAVEIAALGGVAYASGILATRYAVRVNYTRKIVHFTVFLFPLLVTDLFPFEPTAATTLVTVGLLIALIAGVTRPVRSRFGPAATIFAAFDRPEDRPHTLLWLTTQVLAGYAVIIPLAILLEQVDRMALIYIPILINGIGDGLAEPVGVRFGRHEYRVRAVFGTSRTYVRTLEGSACVLVSGIAIVPLFADYLTPPQLAATWILVPIVMTLAEARSPHTWDSPFLFLTGGATVLGIVTFL